MTALSDARAKPVTIETMARSSVRRLARVAAIIAPPLLRIALAVPFFRSGLTRWDGFGSLSPTAAYLFEQEFKLHLFGGAYGFPAPLVVAHLVGAAEIILPILLVLGLGTRFVALGLLAMTGVIQLVVPEGWANFHLLWAATAVAIIAIGPGRLSIDHLLDRWCRPARFGGGS
ncbi:MAG: DoxX family protein [Burkholderiaceae bacterium]